MGRFKAGFHMIADRGSQIAESSAIHVLSFLCLFSIAESSANHVLSSAIVCDHLRSFAILQSYGNQRSAICDRNVSHNIFNSDRTGDSTLLSHKARMFVYSNAHLLLTWLALNIVARYECVYNRNTKNFKDKHKKSNGWEKIGEKFN